MFRDGPLHAARFRLAQLWIALELFRAFRYCGEDQTLVDLFDHSPGDLMCGLTELLQQCLEILVVLQVGEIRVRLDFPYRVAFL